MGKSYDQLSLDERLKVAQLHGEGFSIREIASDLDRSPSTIARELKRNTGQQIGYRPAHAQERARARRWKGSRAYHVDFNVASTFAVRVVSPIFGNTFSTA
jgi:IS30 family transposase